MNKKLPLEERFKAQQKLSQMPRNSAKIRVMNRCKITGRPHGVYRKLKISRIALRDLGLAGLIPGILPCNPSCLKAILDIFNFLYTPCGLPVI